MDDTITTIYCLCDDFLKATGHRDDLQVKMSTAEVITVPLVAAAFFGANVDKTRLFLHEYGYIKKMLGRSRLNRRIHAIKAGLWRRLFALLAELFKRRNTERSYVVDSLPVAVCDNIRIRRCRLYPPEESAGAFRGYIASKRRYFYGLRVHLVVSEAGEPVEFALEAGSEADVRVFKDLELDLPEGSSIFADKSYTDYDYEDLLEEVGLRLKAKRKKNSKRPIRQYVETVFGRLKSLFAGKIQAVTPRGFELKIIWFLLAFFLQCL